MNYNKKNNYGYNYDPMMSNALISEAYELQQYYNRSLKKIREAEFNKLIGNPINTISNIKNKYNTLKNTLKHGLSNLNDIGKTVIKDKLNIKDKIKDKLIRPTVSIQQLDAQSQKLIKTLQDQNKVLKQQIDELTKENEDLNQQLASANATASANAEQAKAATQSAAAAAYPGATISA